LIIIVVVVVANSTNSQLSCTHSIPLHRRPVYAKSSHGWKVSLHMSRLATYGVTSHTWEDFPCIGCGISGNPPLPYPPLPRLPPTQPVAEERPDDQPSGAAAVAEAPPSIAEEATGTTNNQEDYRTLRPTHSRPHMSSNMGYPWT
jgi:hypothetical protein